MSQMSATVKHKYTNNVRLRVRSNLVFLYTLGKIMLSIVWGKKVHVKLGRVVSTKGVRCGEDIVPGRGSEEDRVSMGSERLKSYQVSCLSMPQPLHSQSLITIRG